MLRWIRLPAISLILLAQVPVLAQVHVGYFGTGGAETIRLRLRNTTNQTATHRVYAGEVHPCTLPGNQPLVTGQDATYQLLPQQQRDVLVPVYCGNASLSCPPPGTRFRRPSQPYPRLREILLANANSADTMRIQELIWEETNRARLPESGPPTVFEILQRRHLPRTATGGVPRVLCLTGLQPPPPRERSRTEVQRDNVRAMGWIGLFLIVPLPITTIFILIWLLLPKHRPPGPHRA